MAVEARADDTSTISLLEELTDMETLLSCAAERAFMRKLVIILLCTKISFFVVLLLSRTKTYTLKQKLVRLIRYVCRHFEAMVLLKAF